MVFHLHRFEDDQCLPCYHGVAGLHPNVEHRARHGGDETSGRAT